MNFYRLYITLENIWLSINNLLKGIENSIDNN